MKKITISTYFLIIISFLYKWFSYQIAEFFGILPFSILIFLSLLTFYIILILKVGSLLKIKFSKYNMCLFVVLILGILTFLFVPLRDIKTKVELKLYADDRQTIVDMIIKEELLMKENNVVELPKKYKKLSTSGKVKVYDMQNEGILIGFWVSKCMLCSSSMVLYVSTKEDFNNSVLSKNISYLKEIDENWYYIETIY
ncbi:MAG: hypothetical protein IJY87_01705 [Bacilli bacterium]|nr:hypothetical protein [Bacilli bacterium]